MVCSNIMLHKRFHQLKIVFEKYQVKRPACVNIVTNVTMYVQFSDVPSHCYVNSSQFESVYMVFES